MSSLKATIDISAFRHNLKTVSKIIGKNCHILPVIKSNGYGHGLLPLAREALKNGVKLLGIGTVDEGVELRRAKIGSPIVVLDGFFKEEIDSIIHNKLTPVVFSIEMAQELNRAAKTAGKTVSVHLKFDTGMSRFGIPFHESDDTITKVKRLGNLNIEGVMTHLASSADPSSPQTEFQLSRFEKILERCRLKGITPKWIHAANSGGIVYFKNSHYNMVRPGIILYGIPPSNVKGIKHEFKPVMTLSSRIVSVKTVPSGEGVGYNATYITPRPKRIGVVMGGYADGINRHLSNRGTVLWKSKALPIIGNICMDNFMIDLSKAPSAKRGDEVILLGPQHENISAQKWAEMASTISYEIFCNIGKRVERVIKP
ncbi:MAG: alanine racemase [Nitrospinota bacterium]|nr:alanine racemase [Nitrospinota bacterium]